MFVLRFSDYFLISGLFINFISVIVLIGKLGSFIGTVNNSLRFYEKRLDRLENHIFVKNKN